MAQQEQIRERLRAHGFQFCDDHPGPPGSALTEAPGGIGPELRLTAVDSSSCDHESQVSFALQLHLSCLIILLNCLLLQTIHNTVEESEDRFWSSTGGERADVMEELLYALQDDPCCKFQAVGLYIYRATYQFGWGLPTCQNQGFASEQTDRSATSTAALTVLCPFRSPIYPPKMVAFEVGMHPTQLVAVPGVHVVSCSPDLQLFLLPQETPPAKFVKVRSCVHFVLDHVPSVVLLPDVSVAQVCLLGKQQRQLEDNKYYHAMKRVVVRGQPLSLRAIVACSELTYLRQRQAAALTLSSLASSLDRCATYAT